MTKPIRLCALAAAMALAAAAGAKPQGPLPMKAKWTFRTNSGQYGSVVVADLRGDGQMQVLVPVRRDGEIYCLDAQGRALWRVSLPPGRGASSAPAVGDVDLDGRQEVAVGIEGGGIMLLDADGKQRWHVSLPASVAFSMPVIADLVGDARPEIVVPTIGAGVWCLDWQGNPIWVHRMTAGIYSPRPWATWIRTAARKSSSAPRTASSGAWAAMGRRSGASRRAPTATPAP